MVHCKIFWCRRSRLSVRWTIIYYCWKSYWTTDTGIWTKTQSLVHIVSACYNIIKRGRQREGERSEIFFCYIIYHLLEVRRKMRCLRWDSYSFRWLVISDIPAFICVCFSLCCLLWSECVLLYQMFTWVISESENTVHYDVVKKKKKKKVKFVDFHAERNTEATLWSNCWNEQKLSVVELKTDLFLTPWKGFNPTICLQFVFISLLLWPLNICMNVLLSTVVTISCSAQNISEPGWNQA